MKTKIITSSVELEQFTSREDIKIKKIDIRACEQSAFAQEWFTAVVMYEDKITDTFDWQTFRAETAKVVLAGMMAHPAVRYGSNLAGTQVHLAIQYANELIAQLKDDEQ